MALRSNGVSSYDSIRDGGEDQGWGRLADVIGRLPDANSADNLNPLSARMNKPGSVHTHKSYLSISSLEKYLSEVFGEESEIVDFKVLSSGIGSSLSEVWLVKLVEENNKIKTIIVRESSVGPFGFDYSEDRARQALFCYRAFNKIPGHAEAYAVGARTQDGQLVNLNEVEDFFIIEEFVEGYNYGEYLVSLYDRERVDLEREKKLAESLADYLSKVHEPTDCDLDNDRRNDLYKRSLRDMFGSGEGLMGVIDSFPRSFREEHQVLLDGLENSCLKLVQENRGRGHRLRQVHGDFHPWNIMVKERDGDTVDCVIRTIDKSRVDLNEPANDVGALIMNYLMIDLFRDDYSDRIGLDLARRFLKAYLRKTGDSEILELLPLFIAVRSAAAASPVFYPTICPSVCVNAFKLASEIASRNVIDPDFGFLDSLEKVVRSRGVV